MVVAIINGKAIIMHPESNPFKPSTKFAAFVTNTMKRRVREKFHKRKNGIPFQRRTLYFKPYPHKSHRNEGLNQKPDFIRHVGNII